MAHNSTTICNSAITKLGELSIASLSDTTKAADLCNLRFEFCRDYVLAEHHWKIATTRASLSKEATKPAFEWNAQFSLPSDLIKVISVVDKDGEALGEDDWDIEDNKILSNDDVVYLKYIKRLDNLTFIPEYLAEVIAIYLAFDISDALTQSDTKDQKLYNLYQATLASAKTKDNRTGPQRTVKVSGFLADRISRTKTLYSRFPKQYG